ncbi:hypothetical protein AUEXF2481DRAFT_620054 [Aureobasidium subglaciale EXF-2481]|uniref:Uncharacterized protein n=1 Tax=Aureobasidium subglaciale (strain EXF-2481) TaxID=1043005 RepID=A0A074YS18_AURSE|nr:uncharacterized protein AUEXF2481DRAFT_620054 [Aureobasidium subglaciale EXF-2481]KEQ96907.1 hypothetical protein AUEXF2481DRAFT_620054 [Aureobasidium subglaciale EXF-2481]
MFGWCSRTLNLLSWSPRSWLSLLYHSLHGAKIIKLVGGLLEVSCSATMNRNESVHPRLRSRQIFPGRLTDALHTVLSQSRVGTSPTSGEPSYTPVFGRSFIKARFPMPLMPSRLYRYLYISSPGESKVIFMTRHVSLNGSAAFSTLWISTSCTKQVCSRSADRLACPGVELGQAQ